MTHTPEAERFVPELMSGQLIDAEHRARYALALPHVAGRVVLDAGCGVGWGSALVLQAGAAAVIGVDIAAEAVLDARSRVPEAVFVRADVMSLPLSDEVVDVVICMEALEHTADYERALDEFVRVLRPDGMLFISSPNPDVYPAGNPFHVHELRPDELVAAVGTRLDHLSLYRQHALLTSVVLPETEVGPGDIAVHSELAVPLTAGHDPYSVVIASRRVLPQIAAVEVLVPSQQLDHLATLAAALADERRTIHQDHERVVAEMHRLRDACDSIREESVALRDERDAQKALLEDLHSQRQSDQQRLLEADEALSQSSAQLAEADVGMKRLTTEVDAADAALCGIMAERDRILDEVQTAHDLIADLRADIVRTRAERDRFASALVQAEQALARALLRMVADSDSDSGPDVRDENR